MSDSILGHVRVVEFSRATATSLACQFLAETGADVIRVDLPGDDPQRDQPGFAVWNRSKRSVILDLADAGQRRHFDELLAGADLFFHDLTPAEARALQLDDHQLSGRFANLIAVNITGMPTGHPDDELPCVDSLVLARGGFLDYLQPQRRASGPVYLRFPLGTQCSAYLAAVGAVARLRARDQGAGVGAVHTSLLQGAMVPAQMLCQRAEHPTPGLSPPPRDHINQLVECRDGVWLHLMSPCDHVPSVAAAMARLDPELRQRENARLPAYMRHMPSFMLYRIIFRERDSADWLADLWSGDVAVDAAAPLGKLYFDEQARINQYVVEVDDPQWGITLQPGIPLSLTPPARIKWPARAAGADTEAVLAELEAMPRRAGPVSGLVYGDGDGDGARPLPLAGLRVLDFGNFLAGPLAPELLAELGATVIKVEATTGDQLRWAEWAFCGTQRGKRCIAVDLKNPASRSIIERLVRWADIIHHNLRMAAATKLGLDYQSLRAVNPAIIYSHVSAYGPQGPRSGWPGYDQMMQSAAGWEMECAGAGNAPAWVRFGMTDHVCALSSLLATVLALYHRDRTGQGQAVSASLLGATAITLGETLARPNGDILPYPCLDANQTGISPRQRLYQCADGWLSLFAPHGNAFQALLASAADSSVAALERHFAALGVTAAVLLCHHHGIQAVPVRDGAASSFLDDADFRRLGLVKTSQHPVYGRLELLGQYWHFSGMAARDELPPPTLGQHTGDILGELGFTGAEIARMRDTGLVIETLGVTIPAAQSA